MIYCYLSDTALAPLLNGGVSNYDAYTAAVTGGVCQVTERVLSIFNVDNPDTDARVTPNIVIDPRFSHTANTRLAGLFTGASTEVVGAETERAVGRMVLHYDSYWAIKDNEAGNRIDNVTNSADFIKLFNVLEAIVLTHVYDSVNGKWVYKNTTDLNALLVANPAIYGSGSSTQVPANSGYIESSLIIPSASYATDKTARLQNINFQSATAVVKDGIGTDSTKTSYAAPIMFPDYIQFSFRFGQLSAPTLFRIYLNPKALLKDYSRTLITHIICPANPNDLVNLTYTTVNDTLVKTSEYVADLMTHKITKSKDTTGNETDHLDTTNYSGAMDVKIDYHVPLSSTTASFTFTGLYKGRKPSVAEMHDAIRAMLEEANGGVSVESIFPDLYITVSFIIIPMYDTRVTSDANLNITYCKNVYSTLSFLNNYTGIDPLTEGIPAALLPWVDQLNVAGYFMHCMIYPKDYTSQSAVRFDQLEEFTSYQPIGSSDTYWGVMSEEARDFNQKLSKLIASQLYGYAPTDVAYSLDTIEMFGVTKSYLTFTCGGYRFSMMTREAFLGSAE